MLISEMEAVLKSLDQRVGRIEQILPTLATKAELRDEIREVRVLVNGLSGKIDVVHGRITAEADGLTRRMEDLFDALQQRFDEVLRRLPPS